MGLKQNYTGVSQVDSHGFKNYGRDIDAEDVIKQADTLFEAIGNYGEAVYTGPGRKVAEELALSAASWQLKNVYGRRTNSGKRTLRHLILFGGTGSKKSSMVNFFLDTLFKDILRIGEVDQATGAAVSGTVTGETVTVSPLTTNDVVTLEWDSLVKRSKNIQDVMNKALEEGTISKHTATISNVSDEIREAEETLERANSESGLDSFQSDSEDDIPQRARRAIEKEQKHGLEFTESKMQSPLDSAVIGICHLDSEFWTVYDRSFYRRMFPVFIEPPSRNWDKELEYRRNNKSADVGFLQEQIASRLLTDLDPDSFPEPNPEFFSSSVKDIIGTDDSSIHNSMFITAVAKALLDGKVRDGEIQPDREVQDWLLERIKTQYSLDIDELDDTVNPSSNPTNQMRVYKKQARKMDLVEIVEENQGITRAELSEELDCTKQRLTELVSQNPLNRVVSEELDSDEGVYRYSLSG